MVFIMVSVDPSEPGQSTLAASEARYRRLFETAQDAILILDAEQARATIVDANPFVIDLLGYSLNELIGKELWEIGLFSDKEEDRKSTRLNSSHSQISYAVFCLKKKKKKTIKKTCYK